MTTSALNPFSPSFQPASSSSSYPPPFPSSNSNTLIQGFQNISLSSSTPPPLSLSLSPGSWADKVKSSLPKEKREAPREEQPVPKEIQTVRRLKVVENVHQDDIHSIIRLHDGTFISGSKDGSLKKWTLEGKIHKEIHNPKYINYEKWITATAVINKDYWISGNREGAVHLWDNAGNYIKDVQASPYLTQQEPSHKCKARNSNRVHCLTSFEHLTGLPYFLIGWATQFTLHNYEERERIGHVYTSRNDWVYAIQPITKTALLVITGCCLDLYKQTNKERWDLDCALITENMRIHPRPYISAITPLQHSSEQYGLAVFDGSVRVVDLESKQIIFNEREHDNRVWSIENIREHCFASCADDGFIKFWDIRQARPLVYTLQDNTKEKARVSVLLKLSEHMLLSGSCPDDVKNSVNKARFSFWDIRNLKDD